MSSGKIMVEFDHVSKRFSRRGRGGSLRDTIPAIARRLASRRGAAGRVSDQFWALRDVSFQVRQGEALGIVGHNGAGKSTTLKLLARVTAPTVGHARVNGRFAPLIELGAGFHDDLTGRENVYLNGSILGLRRSEIDRKLESIIDFAGIEKFIDTPVKHYSSGMHARLGFAVAAHIEPEVLLIDEVLSVGDFAFQQKCLRKMQEFRNNGTAIVFVSHNLSAIVSMCSQAILLRTGQVIAAGTPKEVMDAYTNMAYEVVSDEEAAQITKLEHGRVSHHMRIVGAELVDADGRPARSFISGEPATIIVRFRAYRDIRDPIIEVRIRNADTTIVYHTSSSMLKSSVGDVVAGEEIVVSFPVTLNLCRGIYTINASALPLDGRMLTDWRENLVAFEVFNDETAIGIADIKASIAVQRISPQDSDESSVEKAITTV